MESCVLDVNDGLVWLRSINNEFQKIINSKDSTLSELKAKVYTIFSCYMFISEKDNSFYSVILKKLFEIQNKEDFINSFKQAVSCRVQDIIDAIVLKIDDDYFISGTLHHQCSRNIEKVFLIELSDVDGDTICLIKRSPHSRIFRFHKDGRAKHSFNLQEFEGYDHQIHYPDQLNDGEVVDILPQIVEAFSKIISQN